MKKDSFLGVVLLASTIIGAGIFSLPFIFSQIGLLAGLAYLLFFTFVYGLVHLMYARILEKENSDHQFFYLAHKYFPRIFANFASLVIVGDLIFTLLVYLVLAPAFFQFIWPTSWLVLVLIFWLVSSIFIFVRSKVMAWADLISILSMIGIIGLIFWVGRGQVLEISWFQKFDPVLFLLPFGPLLFSLSGRPAIHKIMELRNKAVGSFPLKSVIFWGTAIPSFIYLFFIVSVLRLQPTPSEDVFSSLSFLPPAFLLALGLMGFLSLWDSYFMIGANLKDLLQFDLRYPKWLVYILVLFLPLGLYFIGLQDFLLVIGLAGGIFLALEGVFVCSMWRRAFPEHRWSWVIWPLCLVFIMAIIYEIYAVIR
ncbi:MAG: aromatic amino acid transport family protein [bacterium]|nr:aromatic amino acid transport family protein [bacterium]